MLASTAKASAVTPAWHPPSKVPPARLVLKVAPPGSPPSIWCTKTPPRRVMTPKAPPTKLLLLVHHVVLLRLLKLLWGWVLRGLSARWWRVMLLHLRVEVLLLLWWGRELLRPCCCACARIVTTIITVSLPLEPPMRCLHGWSCKASQHTVCKISM